MNSIIPLSKISPSQRPPHVKSSQGMGAHSPEANIKRTMTKRMHGNSGMQARGSKLEPENVDSGFTPSGL